MILHIINDHRVVNSFLKNFRELYPQQNIVLKFFGDGTASIEKGDSLQTFESIRYAMAQLDYSSIKVIDVQLLSPTKIKAIVRYIPKNIPIVWWTYGGDLYNYFLVRKGYQLYAPQTLKYVQGGDKRNLILILKKIIHDNLYMGYLDKKVLQRIVGIVPCAYPDYEQACLWLGKKFDWVDITHVQKILDYPFSKGNDILLGNSASLTNNHLYAVDILKNISIGKSKIVLPLSYNIQSEVYKRKVMEECERVFGSNAEFMHDMMDLKAYREHFLRFKVAVFPCWRQESLGNIYSCLQLGIRVVLSEHNPCYRYLKEVGFIISSLEEIHDYEPLMIDEQQHNRELFIHIKEKQDMLAPQNLKKYFSQYL